MEGKECVSGDYLPEKVLLPALAAILPQADNWEVRGGGCVYSLWTLLQVNFPLLIARKGYFLLSRCSVMCVQKFFISNYQKKALTALMFSMPECVHDRDCGWFVVLRPSTWL